MYVCMHACMCICIYRFSSCCANSYYYVPHRIWAPSNVNLVPYLYVCIYVCMYACMHVFMYAVFVLYTYVFLMYTSGF